MLSLELRLWSSNLGLQVAEALSAEAEALAARSAEGKGLSLRRVEVQVELAAVVVEVWAALRISRRERRRISRGNCC